MTQPEINEKRSRNYPLRVDVPLALYMFETFDHVDRARRVAKKLDEIVTSQLGLTTQTKILQLTPGNMTSPGGDTETYDVAVLGVFFQNVSRRELDSYAATLTDYFSAPANRNALFEHPDVDLPAPDVEVPSVEWLREKQEEVAQMVSKTKHLVNADGTFNREAAKEDTDAYRRDNGIEAAETDSATTTDAASGANADDEGLGEYADMDESEWF